MRTNILEKADINNSKQWILVRGKNTDAPLLIHVQAGPGLPMIPEANALNKLLQLEEDYLVAYWDQRACGKSFDKNIDPGTINFSTLTDDVIACTKYLLKKYNKDKAIVVGYSVGATLSLMAAVKNSALFSRLFLAGIDIDIQAANKYASEFTTERAKAGKSKKKITLAAELATTPILDAKSFQKRAQLLTDLGGINTRSNYRQLLMSSIRNMLFSNAYRFSDILKTIQGMEFVQNAILPELDTLNLFHTLKQVQVPVHFLQGKHDGIAPYDIAARFFEHLRAPEKTFTTFGHSAHMPHYEEPAKFASLLKEMIGRG